MARHLPSRRGPFRPGRGGFEDFYHLLDDFFNDLAPTKARLQDFRLDVKESDSEFTIEAELPGVDKEEIHLEAKDERLRISVQREEVVDEEQEDYVHKERRLGSMERVLYLPGMDEDRIKASFQNGLLNIQIPKKDFLEDSKRIDIE